MPGQLNLTGASAAIQLVGNDTITEDQEFVFPDTGGTVVTDDFTGDVEIDGNVIVKDAVSFGWDKTGTQSVIKVEDSLTEGRTVDIKKDGSCFFAQPVVCGSDAAAWSDVYNDGTVCTTGVVVRQPESSDNAAIFACVNVQSKDGNIVGRINADGSAVFTGGVTQRNAFIQLDPDDPSKVLDVKESIRNVQSALYRLKAAVLIPDTTVDQLRLRILEALETITEEVD